MTVRKALVLYCDNEHGFGEVTFPDQEQFDWRKNSVARSIRSAARAAGWKRIHGADYCPDCAASIEGREREDA